MAAWIVSFTNTGADAHNIKGAFGGRDELLTNIMLYWMTETAGSAARMYLADAQASWGSDEAHDASEYSDVSTAFALFPREAPTPREWIERKTNLKRYTKMPKGGHFAALEEPDLFVNDLRAFFATFRQ